MKKTQTDRQKECDTRLGFIKKAFRVKREVADEFAQIAEQQGLSQNALFLEMIDNYKTNKGIK